VRARVGVRVIVATPAFMRWSKECVVYSSSGC
jgi:hypothetical protein